MYRAAKRDKNEGGFIERLRQTGMTVQQLDGIGVPDLLVGVTYTRDGVLVSETHLIEVKSATGTLTKAQKSWAADWKGSPIIIARTKEDIEEFIKRFYDDACV